MTLVVCCCSAASMAYQVNIVVHQLEQPRWEVVNFRHANARAISVRLSRCQRSLEVSSLTTTNHTIILTMDAGRVLLLLLLLFSVVVSYGRSLCVGAVDRRSTQCRRHYGADATTGVAFGLVDIVVYVGVRAGGIQRL